ncbi:hypothetical protein THTE_3756 [Thermogutta terrifontis]|uniref:Uncharacterized protein n=1 Tax=Thermogutta terrifontis TaxID=1331910 RepID=A0A286RK79_9BACT|nr:hypothetical protein THTE_3756 [Thermogutta terrifontis]
MPLQHNYAFAILLLPDKGWGRVGQVERCRVSESVILWRYGKFVVECRTGRQ